MTAAFSAPTLAYELISPIYKGVSGWTGKSISTSSRANEGSQNVVLPAICIGRRVDIVRVLIWFMVVLS